MDTSQTIQNRTFRFSVQVVGMIRDLPRSSAGRAIADQLVRSGTSVGANIAEAQDAASRADFTKSMTIALKEARETEYWLKLIVAAGQLPDWKIAPLLAEITEIVKILRASLKKLRSSGKS